MPWNEAEYVRHNKNLKGLCKFTKNSDGGNTVTCDTYSKCSECGWNPVVAKRRANKVRARRAKERGDDAEPETWFLGSGEFPRKVTRSQENMVW